MRPGSAPRESVLAATPRIQIDTPRIRGSIALRGARIDDVSLKDYRETVDPKSPNISLLSPAGSPIPFYAEFGWVAPPGSNVKLPGPDTVWTAASTGPLTHGRNRHAHLGQRRRTHLPAHHRHRRNYMFTVTDEVENTGNAPRRFTATADLAHGIPEDPSASTFCMKACRRARRRQAAGSHLQLDRGRSRIAVQIDQRLARHHRQILGGDAHPRPVDADAGAFRFIEARHARHLPDRLSARRRHRRRPAARLRCSRACSRAPRKSRRRRLRRDLRHQPNFELLIDWGWFYFITKPLFFAIDYFFRLTGNFGVAILIVTVFIKIVFFPLANKSYASMAR
jgi:YidC/Oxa1 family membrane protein insertase